MKLSFRLLVPCLLAGSSLFLLSGCGEFEDQEGGRAYHQHAYGGSYRSDDDDYYARRRYETVDRSDRYDHDRYDRHDRHSTYVDNSRTVVVAPRGHSPSTRSGSSPSHTYASATSGNAYPTRTHSGSGGGYNRSSSSTAVAATTHSGHPGTHHAPPAANRPGNRSTTNVVVNVANQNKQGGSKANDHDKEKEKKKH